MSHKLVANAEHRARSMSGQMRQTCENIARVRMTHVLRVIREGKFDGDPRFHI